MRISVSEVNPREPADLRIDGGTLVVPGQGLLRAGVAIRSGKIAAVGLEKALPPAEEVIDAAGLHVFPGVIDPHVHFGLRDNFAVGARMDLDLRSETPAALAGGVTTIGTLIRERGSYLDKVPGHIEDVERESSADIFFSLWWNEPVHLEEAGRCARAFGITSFKMYMYGVPGSVPSAEDGFLLEGFRRGASLGQRALVAIHAENPHMVEWGDRALRKRQKTSKREMTLADWSDRHPDEAEGEAVQRAVYFASLAGCRLYIVHLSTAMACRRLRELRKGRDHVTVETTSPYLSIDKTHPAGFLAKMTPPFRAPEDREVLWEGIREGVIDTVGTDSAPRTLDQKNPKGGLFGSKGAFPAVETHFPVLLTEGFHRRGIPLHVLAAKTSLGPARAYGLYPRKGTFLPGADADLVLVDLNKTWKVRLKELHSKAGFSLYEGKTLRGKPVVTVKTGKIVFDHGRVLAKPGSGSYLRRSL